MKYRLGEYGLGSLMFLIGKRIVHYLKFEIDAIIDLRVSFANLSYMHDVVVRSTLLDTMLL